MLINNVFLMVRVTNVEVSILFDRYPEQVTRQFRLISNPPLSSFLYTLMFLPVEAIIECHNCLEKLRYHWLIVQFSWYQYFVHQDFN